MQARPEEEMYRKLAVVDPFELDSPNKTQSGKDAAMLQELQT